MYMKQNEQGIERVTKPVNEIGNLNPEVEVDEIGNHHKVHGICSLELI